MKHVVGDAWVLWKVEQVMARWAGHALDDRAALAEIMAALDHPGRLVLTADEDPANDGAAVPS